MPWIENCSLADVESGHHYDPGLNAVLIQIVDPDMEHPTPKYQFREVHKFKFLDIEDGDSGCEVAGMTQADAHHMAKVLKTALENRSNIIVHCHVGVCRSGAVAEVGTMIGFSDTGKYRQPNLRVKRLLRLALGIGWGWENNNNESSGVLEPSQEVLQRTE